MGRQATYMALAGDDEIAPRDVSIYRRKCGCWASARFGFALQETRRPQSGYGRDTDAATSQAPAP